METLRFGDKDFTVREVDRPASKRQCRYLVSVENTEQFLEYVISVGPFKFDLPVVHLLTDIEVAAVAEGRLHLGELAEELANADEQSRRFERVN